MALLTMGYLRTLSIDLGCIDQYLVFYIAWSQDQG